MNDGNVRGLGRDPCRMNILRRHCVFCGSPADSREHVFAKRLCKRAGAIRFTVVPGIYSEGTGTITRKQHLIENFQVRHVCTSCNNGWMNGLEVWFEERLGLLIEPNWPKLALPIIETVMQDRQKLAQWLLKTAVMFNLGSMKGSLPIDFEPRVTRTIKDGILPDSCWVDLAYCKLPTIGGVMGKCFQVINAGQYNSCQILAPGLGFRFTVQFNHLLLRIARAPGANITYKSWSGELPVRMYPSPVPKVHDHIAYDDVMKFEHAVILETWLGCEGNL